MHLSYSVATFLKMIPRQHINRDEEEGISKPAIFSLNRKKETVDWVSTLYYIT